MTLHGGEFGAIARIRSALTASGEGVIQGIGDDCAILAAPRDEQLVVTVDMQVDGIHFRRCVLSPEAIGRRALAVSLSDVAAMGARPLWALVSLGLPGWVDDAYLQALYRGFGEVAARYATTIVGGNLTRLRGPLAIDVVVIGAARRPVRRSGARPGDGLYVTGALGGAAADLAQGRFREPVPRIVEGLALAANDFVHAMIDVSDGLAQDLGHLCRESGVGATLRSTALPLAAGATLKQALYGGEDYELLLAAPTIPGILAISAVPGAPADAAALRTPRPPAPLYRIGEVCSPEEGITLDGLPLANGGWDHFRQERGGNHGG